MKYVAGGLFLIGSLAFCFLFGPGEAPEEEGWFVLDTALGEFSVDPNIKVGGDSGGIMDSADFEAVEPNGHRWEAGATQWKYIQYMESHPEAPYPHYCYECKICGKIAVAQFPSDDLDIFTPDITIDSDTGYDVNSLIEAAKAPDIDFTEVTTQPSDIGDFAFIKPYKANDPICDVVFFVKGGGQILFKFNSGGKLNVIGDPNGYDEAAGIFFDEFLKPIADTYIKENCGEIPDDVELVFGPIHPAEPNLIDIIFGSIWE